MRSMFTLVLTLLVFLIVATQAAADPKVSGINLPRVEGNVGEEFEIRFEIRSDEETNYTLKILPRDEFNWSVGEITMKIPVDDTRTMIFNCEVIQELSDGKYNIKWEAYKNGSRFDSGSLELRAGDQAPGLGGIATMATIGTSATLFAIMRRR